MNLLMSREQNFAEIGRFFGEKSEIGGPGKDFAVEKSEKKNRRKIADFSDKTRFFPIKTDFSPKKTDFSWKFFFFFS